MHGSIGAYRYNRYAHCTAMCDLVVFVTQTSTIFQQPTKRAVKKCSQLYLRLLLKLTNQQKGSTKKTLSSHRAVLCFKNVTGVPRNLTHFVFWL